MNLMLQWWTVICTECVMNLMLQWWTVICTECVMNLMLQWWTVISQQAVPKQPATLLHRASSSTPTPFQPPPPPPAPWPSHPPTLLTDFTGENSLPIQLPGHPSCSQTSQVRTVTYTASCLPILLTHPSRMTSQVRTVYLFSFLPTHPVHRLHRWEQCLCTPPNTPPTYTTSCLPIPLIHPSHRLHRWEQ